jgi:hypothetical protein
MITAWENRVSAWGSLSFAGDFGKVVEDEAEV